jgi:DedD protein
MASRTRSDTPSDAADPALPLKRQARRRLLGALVLAVGVASLAALFFDAEPRPALDDVQVRIPARDTPLNDRAAVRDPAASPAPPAGGASPMPETPVVTAPAPTEPALPLQAETTESRPDAVGAAGSPSAPVGASPTADGPAVSAAAAVTAAAGAAAAASAEPKVPATATKAAGADARAAGADAKAPPATARAAENKSAEAPRGQGYFLQVGAFASEKAARDQVERIRRLGATAFTERIRTQQGERIRVRLGPFPTRDASDAMRNRLRAAGVDVTLVSP